MAAAPRLRLRADRVALSPNVRAHRAQVREAAEGGGCASRPKSAMGSAIGSNQCAATQLQCRFRHPAHAIGPRPVLVHDEFLARAKWQRFPKLSFTLEPLKDNHWPAVLKE